MVSKSSFDAIRFGSLMDNLKNASREAGRAFHNWWMDLNPEWNDESNTSWYIEKAFLKLLVATEFLGLESLKEVVIADMSEASSGAGFAEQKMGPDEPYSRWLSRYSQHLAALETLGPPDQEHSITKDLEEILRATVYSITDRKMFNSGPSSEDEVHHRIEGVLRCVFPDLKHKPSLSKHVKNFIPDTGLPSIRTLIEYKFIDRPERVAAIADEILADTRGYVNQEWNTFLYVIYETRPIKPEHEWSLLLRECSVPESTSVIVLSGESTLATPKRKRKAKASRGPRKPKRP